MADNVTLTAEPRDQVGKGASRAIRRAGRIPAVIYGDKKDPVSVTLSYKDVLAQVNTGTFLSTLIDVEVSGEKFRTIPRDVQFDPVRDFIMHVDFLRLGKGARINVEVPVNFLNEEANGEGESAIAHQHRGDEDRNLTAKKGLDRLDTLARDLEVRLFFA